ncbi:LysR family transcriptional regulator, partial [Escherichia coli]|uniref:LysR substrate-binding domain-containing protein n=1 Tax=Escherichia coli TaxID=562 RepID=UPI001A0BB283
TILVSSMSELLKNMALNGLGIAWLPLWSIADELIKAKDIQFNELPPFTPRKTWICRAQQKLSTMFLAILFNVIS